MSSSYQINQCYPYNDASDLFTSSIIHKGFKISARKLPISKSGRIEEMSASLGIPVPEMIFGDNFVSIEHIASGWHLNFNAYDALDRVEKTGKNMLKVAYSQEWSSSREHAHEEIKKIVKPFDWSYSTDYRGTSIKGKPFQVLENDSDSIPTHLLIRPDPIIFFEEVVLYESELDDNGISLLTCKCRVMSDRMLLLCRFFLRLDNVIFRIRDTRVYIEFETGHVIRDYQEKEDKYDNIKKSLIESGNSPSDLLTAMRDPNHIARILPELKHTLEIVSLP